jgi:hypothetical protein
MDRRNVAASMRHSEYSQAAAESKLIPFDKRRHPKKRYADCGGQDKARVMDSREKEAHCQSALKTSQ